MTAASAERLVELFAPFDLARSLRPWASGMHDPVARVEPNRVVRATRTPYGTATIAVEALERRDAVRVRAWGDGAAHLVERAPLLLGQDDRPETFVAHHRVIERMWADHPGLRITRAPSLFETLVATVLGQRVTTGEALRSWSHLVRRFGEPAPGPFDLFVPPRPEALAELGSHAYHPFGVEARRAETIRRLARRVRRVEELATRPLDEALAKLASFPGVGPWTLGIAAGVALGDADAVPVGDFHLPNEVAWLLAREPRADDARMLELLEPYRGHRFRIIRLVHMSGASAPRYGPRRGGTSLTRVARRTSRSRPRT
jgi:3-methyladenine DNA glycosylase/8-oxoguanine DNA glycosylase